MNEIALFVVSGGDANCNRGLCVVLELLLLYLLVINIRMKFSFSIWVLRNLYITRNLFVFLYK